MTPSPSAQRYPWTSYLMTLHRIKGWPYIASWAHRLSGLLLYLYLFFHVFTLSSLQDPERFDSKMQTFGVFFPPFLEWLLAVPVIFHALNGGRLLLYEVYGTRRDRTILRWVLLVSGCYLALLGVFMFIGGQTVSPVFFWSYLLVGSGLLTYLTVAHLRQSGASLAWKMQRLSAAFLLLMIPAHMLFMHLDPALGRDSQVILARMSNGFIKVVDILLVLAVLYHGAYGVRGVIYDYVCSARLRSLSTTALILASLVFAWLGLTTILSI
ncbi:succinate dehydrogenase, hydrophobic membrane anchor protein [Desulfofustis limnaeus]|uniref:Succinate dehydrogenase hydrophobic membrane anchor subunit n=1 Tax=Desulfofustis limnaeus TaxID=2740163 RepID=A0ABM7W8E6_9BACT|nr:succinate dehydrogenase, hydrophobic membrane anchor protein [Desulfofustis limnaeus]MDX9895602.1 succinate dehydrogenase, hydrophobic membrane anchor protein [Desulfofustis sp.]BDD87170.1 hypothetical protein DPPLL_15350 [Desulfofustis limnaeus]